MLPLLRNKFAFARNLLFADSMKMPYPQAQQQIREEPHSQSPAAPPSHTWGFYAAVVEFSDDAIVTKDLDGIITSWNRAAQKIFGYMAEEAIGKPVIMLLPLDRQDEEP